MRHYYSHRRATYCEYLGYRNGELVNPCGDRAIIRVDKRLTLWKQHELARENNGVHRPRYDAYQLFTGELNRDNYQPITGTILLQE